MSKKKSFFEFTGLVIIITMFMWTSVSFAWEETNTYETNQVIFDELQFLGQGSGFIDNLLKTHEPYAKDVICLNNLHLLPTEELDWTKEATWSSFLGILGKLQAKKQGILPGLDNYLPTSNYLTYAETLEVLLMMLHYPIDSDAANVDLAKRLGISVPKTNIYESITGTEMAHLIYQTLKQKPLKDKKIKEGKTLFEEIFIIQNMELGPRKVLKKTSTAIELEYEGTFTLASDVIVIDDANGEPLSMSDVVIGMTGAYFAIDSDNVIRRIGIIEKFIPQQIRVLISSSLNSTGGSVSYDFTDVKVSANKTVYVRTKKPTGNNTIATVSAGTTFTLTCSGSNVYYNGSLAGSRVFIESDYSDVQLTLKSTTRSGGVYPVYEGKLEATPSATANKLYVINDLPMEKYLYKVVPSEMPASWHVEALKCQAVAARSYAVGQIYGSGYANKGANVDDSTNCQVYNNVTTTQGVIDAVNATKAQVMTYLSEVITAYFFSTSAGYTAHNEEVWHNSSTGAFPGVALPYVRAKQQIPNYTYPNFVNETETLSYYKAVPTTAYDYSAGWFRWNINLTRSELEKTISKNLPLRESADQTLGTDFIQTISGIAPTPGSTTFSIGTLLDIRVIQRGAGGNIMNLEIVGTNGVWRVLKEYNVRMVLKPTKDDTSSTRDIIIYCHNGVNYTNYSLLPSAFCSFQINKSGTTITDVIIYGGGNGHGVGMSQYGAKGYAEKGYTYQTILTNFYSGITFTTLY